MRASIRNMTCGLMAVGMVALMGAGSAVAGPVLPLAPRLRPIAPHPVNPFTPRLGIMGHIQYGRGMVVDSVNHGTVAARLGLERGDMIVRINDRQINNDRGYQEALWSAARYLDGYVDLVVVDVRSGRTTHRTGYLRTGSGPIVPRAASYLYTRIGAAW